MDRLGVLDAMLDATGQSRGDGLPVITAFGLAALAGIDGADTVWLDIENDDFDGPFAVEDNLLEIVFSGLDASFNDAFEQAAASNGEFDERLFEELIDSQLAARGDEIELRVGRREGPGVDYVVAVDAAEVLRSVDRLQSLLLVTTPFLIAGAALVTWLLTGRALSPVRRMTSQVSAISGGNLHERVHVPSTGDEVEDLGATMNGMLDRLEADDQRLRQFISDASHELRSPVAVLRSEAEVALRTPESTDPSELAEGVLGESLRLERIVTDLLVLARGDEAGSPAASTVVDGRRRRVGRSQTSSPGCRSRRPRCRLGECGEPARAAPESWCTCSTTRPVMPSRGVSVGLRSDGVEVTLTVDDDGPGIAPADSGPRVRAVHPPRRGAHSRHRRRGLGLAVVAATVLAMGGTVEATDSPLGGARLEVRWPAAS